MLKTQRQERTETIKYAIHEATRRCTKVFTESPPIQVTNTWSQGTKKIQKWVNSVQIWLGRLSIQEQDLQQ